LKRVRDALLFYDVRDCDLRARAEFVRSVEARSLPRAHRVRARPDVRAMIRLSNVNMFVVHRSHTLLEPLVCRTVRIAIPTSVRPGSGRPLQLPFCSIFLLSHGRSDTIKMCSQKLDRYS